MISFDLQHYACLEYFKELSTASHFSSHKTSYRCKNKTFIQQWSIYSFIFHSLWFLFTVKIHAGNTKVTPRATTGWLMQSSDWAKSITRKINKRRNVILYKNQMNPSLWLHIDNCTFTIYIALKLSNRLSEWRRHVIIDMWEPTKRKDNQGC